MDYEYPCDIVGDEEEAKTTGREAYNVSFPDIPPALTCGWSWEEAVAMAKDCLGGALGIYVELHEDIPAPSPTAPGQVLISVPIIVAAKLELYTAMRSHRVTQIELAKRLGITDRAIRRLLDPLHRSHISQVENALRAVGRTLTVSGRDGVPGMPDHVHAGNREPVKA